MKNSVSKWLLLAAILPAVFSCGKENDDDVNNEGRDSAKTGITTINVVQAVNKTMTMEVGEKAEVEIKWLPADADVSSSSWESSNKDVVQVDYPRSAEYATVKALKEGEATITARVKDEDGNVRAAKTLITVVKDKPTEHPVFIKTLTLDKKTMNVQKGDEFTVTAKYQPSDADYPEILWDVSDQSVLSFEPSSTTTSCKFKALKGGGATIYAFSAYSDASAELPVVVGSKITSLRLPEGTISLRIGETGTFSSAWTPDDATETNVLWDVDPNYLEVIKCKGNNLTVRAVGIGEGDFVKVSTQSKGASASAHIRCHDDGIEAVDLGLSVLWGTRNIGASSPLDPGLYFAWGETRTKNEFEMENYAFYARNVGFTKYCYTGVDGIGDGKSRLEAVDDIATRLGSKWRMPTLDEIEELKKASKSEGYQVTANKNGKMFVFTNTQTGKSITIPFSGYRYGKSLGYTTIQALFWTSDLCLHSWESKYNRTQVKIQEGSSEYAQHFDASYESAADFLSGNLFDCVYWSRRSNGFPVRPVRDK
jgi:uncharacterized protein YjdB